MTTPIRQICPNCFQDVTLAPEAAGTTVACPACAKPIEVPGRHRPAVDPGLAAPKPTTVNQDAPPPGFVPPVTPAPSPTNALEPAPTGGPRRLGLEVSPQLVAWLPAAALTFIFVLSFFNWVGSYPGGYKVYGQSPWGALVRSIDTDYFRETVVVKAAELKTYLHSNWLLMLPYLLGLVVAVVVAWGERVAALSAGNQASTSPFGALAQQWRPRLPLVVAGLAFVLLVLLYLQLWAGFGLENAFRDMVAAHHTEALQAAKTEADTERETIKAGLELGQYQVKGTFTLTLVVMAHLAALAAALVRVWLDRRGSRPLPRLSLDF